MTLVSVGSGRTATRLHVERDGTGEPLLWITGFAISSEIFSPVMARYTGGYDCIRYDNRGSGRSESRWRATSVPELAGDAVRLLDALDLHSAHVYGLSMGGMIAQEMAIRFPDRVRALVLGATSHGGPRSALPNPRIAAALTSRTAPKKLRAELVGRALFTDAYRAREPQLVRDHLLSLAAHPARTQGVLSHLLASTWHDTRARLGQVQAPTLVLHGAQDRLTPVANAHRVAALIPDASLVVLPDAGHGYLVEEPAAAARAFHDWIRSRSPVRPGRPLSGLAAAAEPLTRAFGLPVGALRTAASLWSPPHPPTRW